MATAKKPAKASPWDRLLGPLARRKKNPNEPEVLWTIRLGRAWAAFYAQIREIARGLRSSDGPTRRMSALFFASLIGFVSVMGLGSYVFWKQRSEKAQAMSEYEKEINRMGDFFAKRAEEAKRRNTIQDLGKYTFSIRRDADAPRVPGVVYMGEMELYAECDARETCAYVDENMTSVRSHVSTVFVDLSRDEILTREGKRRLKKQLLDRLNVWLPRGKIKNLYFSRLIIS